MRGFPFTPALAAALIACAAASPSTARAADSIVGLIVPGTSNPWLAGMPDGSGAKGDTAPNGSPALAGISLTPGGTLHISATGSVNYVPSPGADGPDGTPGFFLYDGGENGIGGIQATVNSLLGVFLDATQPDATPPPPDLLFPTSQDLDYTRLEPALKQVFFIGDGLTSEGMEQVVVIPAGATRLYLGMLDGSGWYNNSGQFTVDIHPGAPPAFSAADVAQAMRIAAGILAAGPGDIAHLNVETTGGSAGVIDMADVARLARIAARTDPSP